MKTIALNISEDRILEIGKFLYYKKIMGDLLPDDNPVDWIALEVVKAYRSACVVDNGES